MFNKSTIFVIGAGAGAEIKMPMGGALSATIADKTHIKYKDYGHDLQSGDAAIADALKRITSKRGIDFNEWRAEACAIREGIHHTRSIDAYLNTHKENEAIKTAGKLAIVQSILEAEGHSDLARSRDGQWHDSAHVARTWFADLFYIMQDGVGKADDIRDIFKNVSFITFNYDRCLEHYLHNAIRELYRLDWQSAAEIMQAIQIVHPYGQVGSLDWEQQARRKVAFGADKYDDIEGLAEEIKTFNEQVSDEQLLRKIHDGLDGAERIVFLGFHFHKQNMDLMTVTNNENGTVRPVAYATALNRSGPEQEMIRHRISKLTGVNRAPKGIELSVTHGCHAFFQEYGATWL